MARFEGKLPQLACSGFPESLTHFYQIPANHKRDEILGQKFSGKIKNGSTEIISPESLLDRAGFGEVGFSEINAEK